MRLLLVDGYNVIRQVGPYREMAEDDLDAARAALVSDVAAYSASSMKATVVFDGGGNRHSDGTPHQTLGITVIFSPFNTTADSVIERLAREARERGDHVDVVTSDAETQWSVLGMRAVRRSASEFGGELRDAEADWREHNPLGCRRARLEDRIDPSVREILAKWARQ